MTRLPEGSHNPQDSQTGQPPVGSTSRESGGSCGHRPPTLRLRPSQPIHPACCRPVLHDSGRQGPRCKNKTCPRGCLPFLSISLSSVPASHALPWGLQQDALPLRGLARGGAGHAEASDRVWGTKLGAPCAARPATRPPSAQSGPGPRGAAGRAGGAGSGVGGPASFNARTKPHLQVNTAAHSPLPSPGALCPAAPAPRARWPRKC